MRLPGRARFADVINAQLDLYVEQNADLLRRVETTKQTYDRSDRTAAEEAYGAYMDAVEEAEDALLELRDRYAETMAARERRRYEREFFRAAGRMLPTLQSRRHYLRAIDPDSTT